ncbi:ABC transporter permease (plasmid) [Streptomyces sp. NBC_00053]|uniref:ABC transporter permease n=1 Tax=unclassified Streptomyces TaxID=2593676 RepID=UPI000F5BCEDD|nr:MULTISPECIES: ABC transporter permease [unclassified Streptomyces]WSG56119.1 ABC transporter permease [Streptomyces sp. NBC_01732]WSX07285.1 ABC transporter permease [Streptomyces sp. NBC_00987]MCX4399536.1 ABC transporter permease [Streptomyces sp. NBC_01767]MCX5165494.1 ABC transporter permease [Streptomyces sp. NBC_00305]MCX5224373.1 ABC transporter permease [Streptomyces sp. NBC_00264]
MTPPLRRTRLRPTDTLRLGMIGPRTRKMRSALSALGISLGIAAVIAVTGISASNQAHLLERLDRLGSNLITVAPGNGPDQKPVPLPPTAEKMLANIAPVQQVTATGATKTQVYRNDLVPPQQTNSLTVLAARLNLLDVLHATLQNGHWLDKASENLPMTVLGDQAALRLGVTAPGERVWLGGQWFVVNGILAPNELAPELGTAALVGWPEATAHLGADGTAAMVYLRAHPERVPDVQTVAGATADPANPSTVAVSRPSDLYTARAETKNSLTGLVLALAAVALLVGGVGIANTMVVGVMERRGEVGLRRALGARGGQIAVQFLIEAVLMGLIGGVGGLFVGSLAVYGYALAQGWPASIPLYTVIAGPLVSVLVAAVAGIYPALRAARVSPTDALRSA